MLVVEAVAKGGPEVLQVAERPVPEPGPGEILIRHAAIGLNFIDTYHRSGLYPVEFPTVLGLEGAGVVERVGEGVTRFRPGDRCAYAGAPRGGYAQFAVRPEGKTVKLPDKIPFEIAAASMLKGMTAEFLLRRCYPVKAGETILVHAAAGGVGQILVQWAKAIGATVIATAGGAKKTALVRQLGADHVIDYDVGDVAERVRALTGGAGVPVAYDSVGAATFEATLKSLAKRGMFVSFGSSSGPVPAFPPSKLAEAGSLFLTRPTLFDYILTPEELDASAAALFEMIASGKVMIDVGQTFPLAEARAAHEALEGRKTTGSTLLIP
jgi:NADPH2:quinone reductase